MSGEASEGPRTVDPDLVETPVGRVDLGKARANCAAVVAHLAEYGLAWRPHIKSHKSTRLARLQLEAGARGLTVATAREAEVMATVTDDLLLAYPPVGTSKLSRLMELPRSVDLKVGLDSVEVARGLSKAAEAAAREVGVLVEVDVGLRRVGVQTPELALALIREVNDMKGLTYRGLMFYPGHVRASVDQQGEGMRALGECLTSFLDHLESADSAPEIVSGGSTPTLWHSQQVPGVTEVRAGTALFYDREQVALGVAPLDQVAYSVLATVVSVAIPGQAVVDAGSKALSKEGRGGDGGFGIVLDRPEVQVRALSEEHGVLELGSSSWQPHIGERVRIVPNHVCVSVNLQDHLLVEGEDGAELWPLEARGRGRYRDVGAAWTG